MYIDLQFHSTYSDGRMTPTKLVDFLANNNIKVAALTDHNTVAGIDEFFRACQKKNIKPIVGIELYVRYGTRGFNFLFYNFDKDHPYFHNFLIKTYNQRRRNVIRSLKYWQDQGIEINIDKIINKYKYYIPTNGIVRTIIRSKYNSKFIQEQLGTNNLHEGEVINFLFKSKKRYFLSETYVSIHRMKNLHKKIGGQVILCHPGKKRISGDDIIKMLKQKYIDGIEILSPHHSWDIISYYQHKLKNKKLIYTGGSDFHGNDSKSFIDCSWDYFKIKSELLSKIERIIG